MSGSLAHPPSRIVQQLLVDLSQGTLPSAAGSWPIAAGEQLDTPGSAVFVRGTEALTQGRSMLDGYVYEKHGIQVLVRDTRYEDGDAKARVIAIALDGVKLQTVTISACVYVVALFQRTGGVMDLGKERQTSRPLFSVNGYATIRQTS